MAESPSAPAVSIIGLHGGQWYGRDAEQALRKADLLIGAARQFELLPDDLPGERRELWGPLDQVLDLAESRARDGQSVAILASGDPGFFGFVRIAAARFGAGVLAVHPAPSAVALAFARAGVNWDDAVVVSAHGRPLDVAVATALTHPKVAVLVSRDNPPEAIGAALVDSDCGARDVTVCSRLGEPDEVVVNTDLAGLAAGTYDPLSVVLLRSPDSIGRDNGMGVSWGRAEDDFEHRAGMITKAEVRAVALGKLSIPGAGVLWDVGAGSGSVAAECARLAPGLRVYAVERRSDDVQRLRRNVRGLAVTVVEAEAPACLDQLPAPDRVFVGGGGIEVLDAALGRLRPNGVIVATYATIDHAAVAAERLGNLVQVAVSRGARIGDRGGFRLAAENPVFVCWGPERAE